MRQVRSKRPTQRIEHVVKEYIMKRLPPPSGNDSRLTGSACGESLRRADLLWIGVRVVVQVEIDENEHKDRSVSCELAKMDASKWGLHADHQTKPTFFIRFNPDGCDREELYRRCDRLIEQIEQCLSGREKNDLTTEVMYMYYSKDSKHVRAAKEKAQFRVRELN